jgi:lysophospholipase L1-like esterase
LSCGFACLALASCGDPAPATNVSDDAFAAMARLGRPKPGVRPVPVENAEEPPAIPRPPAALRNEVALEHFYAALAALEEHTATEDVRIVQFGDSHTAADLETGEVRRELQARFGDGGRGFVPLGEPYKNYYQEGVRVGSSGFKGEHGKLVHGHQMGDGAYGLLGVSVVGSRPGARAWTDAKAPASRIELAYLAQPGGGSVDLSVDGHSYGRVSTASSDFTSAFQLVDVPEGPHHIEARALGDGEVRVFGVALDRSTPGVSLDALGINGARITTPLSWNELHLEAQLRHRDPALVILAFGTNESGDDTPARVYERELIELVGRVGRAVPSASCLLLGPADRAGKTADGEWQTMPKLLEVIDSQARVAAAAGCAFYDQLTAMGGPGTIAAWASESPARARPDHVHFSLEGYHQLGAIFSRDVLASYDGWRLHGAAVTPAVPPPVPSTAPAPASPPPASPPTDADPAGALPPVAALRP